MKKTLLLFITLLSITFTYAQTEGATFTSGDYTYEVTATTTEVKVIGYTVTDLNIPATVTDGTYNYNVTLLPSGVFNTDTNITSVTSMAAVAIGLQAFNACSGIETVNLPNAISIGNSAFLNCSALTTADLSGITGTLGNNTFKNCAVLTTLDVSSATIAGNNAFENTGTLANADFSSLVSLGAQTFRNTSAVSLSFPALTHVGNASDSTSGLVFWQASDLKTIDLPVIEVINTGAFNSCSSLESITFPATLTSLTENNYNMFKGCTSLANVIVEYTTFIPLGYNPDGTSVNTSIFADVFGATLTIPSSANAADYTTGDVWKDFGSPVLNVNAHEAALGWDFYPNPTKDLVTIQNTQSQNADITVFDLNGRALLNKTINNVQSEINISSLNTGIYLFQVKTDAGEFVKRIAKQ